MELKKKALRLFNYLKTLNMVGGQMALTAAITDFKEKTGREDLTSDQVTAYLNRGQRTLDRMLDASKMVASKFFDLVAGQVIVFFTDCRAILKVYIYDGVNRFEVAKSWLDKMLDYYNKPKASLVGGAPAYYAPVHVRPHPTNINSIATVSINAGGTGYSVNDVLTIVQVGASGGTATVTQVNAGVVTAVSLAAKGIGYSAASGLSTTVSPAGGTGCKVNILTVAINLNQQWAAENLLAVSHMAYNGILLMPPVDVSNKYSLEIRGLFYTDTLVNATDATFWTEVHPGLLTKAAAYELEVDYRNTEGMNDWMAAIRLEIDGIDKDIVEEEIAGITEMEVKLYEVS